MFNVQEMFFLSLTEYFDPCQVTLKILYHVIKFASDLLQVGGFLSEHSSSLPQ